MKISIRRGVFETNSSSNHSLILSTKDKLKDDIKKIRIKHKMFYSYNTEDDPIASKEDKCYFLNGIFEEALTSKRCSLSLYKIFKRVLKDNNENEILNEIENHMINYNENNYALNCEDYFCHGVLCECNCNFLHLLEEYYSVYLWLAPYTKINDEVEEILDIDSSTSSNKDIQKQIYDMFYDYIYTDVIVVPYEYA